MDNSPDSGKKAGVMVKNGVNFSTELAFFTLVCLKEFTRRQYGRLSIVEIPGIPESLTPEEKLGFERFVEELQGVGFDKPKCSDFDS